MQENISTMTSKGQITIPVEIRRYLGVQQGDKLSFRIDDSGAVSLQVAHYPTVASLRERSPELPQELSYDDMKEIAYEERLTAKYQSDV